MEETGNHRKRKRLVPQSDENLLVGNKVEVRSVEDGFEGSWHEGTIIGCENGCRKVKYDYLFDENEANHLTEIVKVASADKIFMTSKDYKRGRIRPCHSFGKLTKEDISYGLCVDCYHDEAWWEGVVFDHKVSCSKRTIFFPDLGDELQSNIKSLRLTHDWNEDTGMWTRRGKWMFLEILAEHERDAFIPVSLKQIWYDVRAKNEFSEIREWPCSVHSLWRKLIAQVIDENLRLTVGALVERCMSAQDEELTRKNKVASEIIDANPRLTVDALAERCMSFQDEDLTRKNKVASETIDELCDNDELAMTNVRNSVSVPGNSHLVPVQPQVLSMICSDQEVIEFNTCDADEKMRKGRCNKNLQPENLKPEFCPGSLYEYVQTDHPSQTLTQLTRRHLCSLGYKMEHCQATKGVRYESPRGKSFFNLRKCANFEKQVIENSSLAAEDFQSGKRSAPDDGNCVEQQLKVARTSEICNGSKKQKVMENSSLAAEEVHGERSVSPDHPNCSSEEQLMVLHTSEVYRPKRKGEVLDLDVEPKYCSEAITKYLKENNHMSSKSELVDEARAHLSAIGWKFWPFFKRGGKYEWRYDSPTTGKTYNSLLSVCRAFVGGTETHSEERKALSGGEISLPSADYPGCSFSKNWSRNYPRALRKYKSGKVQRRKEKVHVNHQSIKKLSTSFVSKKNKALGKVGNSSRELRSTKRARQAGSSSSSKVPLTVLSWMIDNSMVLAREKVEYYRQGDDKPTASGRVTFYGINCSCCSQVFTLSGFEAHAGCFSRQPAAHIFFCKDGKSLVERQLEIMRQNVKCFSVEPLEKTSEKRLDSWNDHICSICRYGGELILCDRCPSSFHARCLGLQEIPDGDWFCSSCCCGICGKSHVENAEFPTNKNVLACHQCERQYHARCIRERDVNQLESTEKWFCCNACQRVYWGLQQLLGKPIVVDHKDLTWTLMKPMDFMAINHDDCDVLSITENYSKLRVALEVMHECFEPVKEPRTKRDLVEDVIFCRGSHLNRLNFQGFYTVLLERNEELISVAILRVYGDKVAEIPLIGTRFKHRRLGMCRMVMDEIEQILIKLGVKRLVLPAAASVLNTWTTAFEFTPVTEVERSEFLCYSFLDFQDTILCQKPLRKRSSPLPRRQLSIDASGTRPEAVCNMERGGTIADPEGNSSISEVSQEDRFDESETVDQGAIVKVTDEKSNGGDNLQNAVVTMVTDQTNQEREPCNALEMKKQKVEHNKSDGSLKCYKRKNSSEPRSPVSRDNCPKVEVSCR
ncbi:unnamed protein product [Amaranthus hypochondriacus]